MFLTSYFLNLLNLNFYKNKNFNNNKKNLSFKTNYFILKFFYNLNKKKSYLFLYILNSNFFYSIFLNIFFLLKLELLLNNNNQTNVAFNYNNLLYFYSKTTNNSKNYLFSTHLFFFKINSILNNISTNNLFKNFYNIKFSISDFFKYLNNSSINYINILFLRKNKIFNKGRYSRNRQYYRTGVY